MLGDEVQRRHALFLLLFDPVLELLTAGHERRNPVARVEVLALPVHLVGDDPFLGARSVPIVGLDDLTLAPVGCGLDQVDVEGPQRPRVADDQGDRHDVVAEASRYQQHHQRRRDEGEGGDHAGEVEGVRPGAFVVVGEQIQEVGLTGTATGRLARQVVANEGDHGGGAQPHGPEQHVFERLVLQPNALGGFIRRGGFVDLGAGAEHANPGQDGGDADQQHVHPQYGHGGSRVASFGLEPHQGAREQPEDSVDGEERTAADEERIAGGATIANQGTFPHHPVEHDAGEHGCRWHRREDVVVELGQHRGEQRKGEDEPHRQEHRSVTTTGTGRVLASA